MSSPSILVVHHALGIDTEVELGVFADVLREERFSYEGVDAPSDTDVSLTMRGHAGLIVMGGTMSVYEQEQLPYLTREMRLIRQCLADNIPVLGICLGAQLLAAALGARVSGSPRREVGWREVRMMPEAANDPLFHGLPAQFSAFHWHGDRLELPTGAVRLAWSDLTPNQAFRFEERAWGIQFHPEMRVEAIEDWMTRFAGEMAQAGVTSSEIRLGTTTSLGAQQAVARTLLRRWLALTYG